jgi:hypothetical protein
MPRDRLLRAIDAYWPETRTLGDALELLHEQTGLEFLADSFIRVRVGLPFGAGVHQRQPLGRLLPLLTRGMDYDWWKEGPLVRFRSRRYAFDRLEEPPQPVLEWFREITAPEGRPTLDDFAALATRLTDPQAEGLDSGWGWYFPPPHPLPPMGPGLYPARHMLRWWATLTETQRKAVQSEGPGLPMATLAPEQRQLLYTALSEAADPRSGQATGGPPLEVFAALSVRLRGVVRLMEVLANPGEQFRNVARREYGEDGGIPGGEDLVLLGPPFREFSFEISFQSTPGASDGLPRMWHLLTLYHLPRRVEALGPRSD